MGLAQSIMIVRLERYGVSAGFVISESINSGVYRAVYSANAFYSVPGTNATYAATAVWRYTVCYTALHSTKTCVLMSGVVVLGRHTVLGRSRFWNKREVPHLAMVLRAL